MLLSFKNPILLLAFSSETGVQISSVVLNPDSSDTSRLHHAAKFDPNEVKVVNLRYTGGNVSATSGPCGSVSKKKVGDDITKATGDGKGLRITIKLTIQNGQA